jgi:hypothetical protein
MATEIDLVITALSSMNEMIRKSLERTEKIPVIEEVIKNIHGRLEDHIDDNKEDHRSIFERLTEIDRNTHRKLLQPNNGIRDGKGKIDVIWDVIKIGMSVIAGALIIKLAKF